MNLSKNRKIAAGLATVATAATLTVGGVFAAFTDTSVTAPQTITAGNVTIALADGADSTPPVKFTQDISALAPGDNVYRALTIKNVGNLNMATLGMTAASTPSNALVTTAPASGLGVSIDSCSQPWTVGSPTAAPTCGGTTTTVKAATSLSGLTTNTPITGSVLTAGGAAHLMFRYNLASAATDAFENLSTNVTYTFSGTQRAGTTNTQ